MLRKNISGGVVIKFPQILKEHLHPTRGSMGGYYNARTQRVDMLDWSQLKKQKLEAAGSSGASSLKDGNDGLVVGPDAPTANSKDGQAGQSGLRTEVGQLPVLPVILTVSGNYNASFVNTSRLLLRNPWIGRSRKC